MPRFMFLFVLAAAALVVLVSASHCHDSNPQPLSPNTYPISDGVKSSRELVRLPNGTLSSVQVLNSGNDTTTFFYLLHIWGTPYDMGVTQARLYTKAGVNLISFIDAIWEYFKGEAEKESFLKTLPKWLADWVADLGLRAALEATEIITAPWTGAYFYDELQGLADGLGMTTDQYRRLVWIHMLPGLTEGKCSMFGAWGAALDPTDSARLLQLRSLDWDMDGPFRDLPAVVVYHPDSNNGNTFMSVGLAGFIGGLTGVSSAQLGISEIGVAYPDSTFGSESRFGVPFVFLLRDILQFDTTLQQALNRITNTKRTCDLILGVGDGKIPAFRGVAYSSEKLTVMDDTNQLPLASWHPRIPDIVYWGMDWVCVGDNILLSKQIQTFYGNISGHVAVAELAAVQGSGSNHLAYYDLTNLVVWVSFAAPHGVGGPVGAFARQFTLLDAKALFAVPRPGL